MRCLTNRVFALGSIMLALLAPVRFSWAEDQFNLRILELGSPLENTSTLADFLKDNGLIPGKYLTSIIWGDAFIDKREINFTLSQDKQQLIPQFTKADLRGLGVKVALIDGLKALQDDALVGDIAQYIEGAQYDFRLESQTLYLRIPQRYRDSQAVGAILPKFWDDGISAAWVSYYVSGSRQDNDDGRDASQWVSLNSGINIGPWRLRNNSAWGNGSGWETLNTRLQRDIKALGSQLEMGQIYTNGELFDGVQMTGVKLETDTNMLPESQQGFAPVVKGIANSDAKVTIKQNGYILYQTTVPAGPFEISDLSQVTAGTDLDVTIQEADGSERHFVQASSSVPVLLREGALKYSLAAGKYRSDDDGDKPGFGQASVIYGLPHGMTAYSGLMGAPFYYAALVGTGADLAYLGAISVDLTTARTQFDDGRDDATGLSWRAQYAKDFPATNTMVTLGSYRYSTSGFYTFQEAIDQRDKNTDEGIYSYRYTNNRRSRLQLNLSQSAGAWGSVYLNSYQQDYWNMSGHERSVTLGFSSSWRDITWSVNYSLTRTPNTDDDQQLFMTVNVPLSRWLPNTWSTYSVNRPKNGSASHSLGIGGTALENNNLNYNVQQTYTDNQAGYGASMSGRYRGSHGEVGLGYSYTHNTRQWNYSAQGSVVAHSYGVTFGRSVQDAFAIVHIQDGADINVQNAQGIYTDAWGNAVVPTLSAYRHNTITVNTQERTDIAIEESTKDVIPTKGAIVLADFNARSGRRGLLTLLYRGKAVPFGAILSQGEATAIVGDDGEVYLTGIQDQMSFNVQWGERADQKCAGKVTVPPGEDAAIFKSRVVCQ